MNTHDGDMTSINVILAAAPAGITRPQVAGLVGARYMRDPDVPPGDHAALGMPFAAHPGPAAVTAAVIRRRRGPWAPACGLFWRAHKIRFRYGMDVGFSPIGPGHRGGSGQPKTTKPHFPPKLYILPDSATNAIGLANITEMLIISEIACIIY
jgi:hypothetical protein